MFRVRVKNIHTKLEDKKTKIIKMIIIKGGWALKYLPLIK